MSKKISICHPELPHFAKDKCRNCYLRDWYQINKNRIIKRHKAWRDANRDKHIENNRRWRKNNTEKTILKTIKQRAKRKNLEFNLSLADIVIPTTCPVLNIPIIPFGKKFSPNAPSVDRIDNTKGYVKGNIVIVSFRANCIKNNATVEELKKIYEFYSSLENKEQ